MIDNKKINEVKKYFHTTLSKFGATSKGVDWNTEETREARFDQIMKVVNPTHPFSNPRLWLRLWSTHRLSTRKSISH